MPAAGQYGIVRVDDVNAPGYDQVTGPFEIIQVGSNNTGTNTLSSLTRGQEGTSAHAFAAGSVWSQVLTAGSINTTFTGKFASVSPSGVGSFSQTIPAGINNVEIRWTANPASGVATQVFMQYNGVNTGNLYYYRAAGTPVSSANQLQVGATGSSGNPNFGNGVIHLTRVADTSHYHNNTATYSAFDGTSWFEATAGGLFASTPAITSVQFFMGGTPNFAAGSVFDFYGLP